MPSNVVPLTVAHGDSVGPEPSAWDLLGRGFKSLTVTRRKTLGLDANVRPCVSYSLFVDATLPSYGRGE